jgi:hypothetical protein
MPFRSIFVFNIFIIHRRAAKGEKFFSKVKKY